MKKAGIAGVLLPLFIFLALLGVAITASLVKGPFFYDRPYLAYLSYFVPSLLLVLSNLCFIYYFKGFQKLGEHYHKKLLRISSKLFVIFGWIFLVMQLIYIFFSIVFLNGMNLFYLIFVLFVGAYEGLTYLSGSMFYIFGVLFSVIFLLFFIIGVLFLVGLIVSEKIKGARLTGILGLIGFFFIIVAPIAYILSIFILFRERKGS